MIESIAITLLLFYLVDRAVRWGEYRKRSRASRKGWQARKQSKAKPQAKRTITVKRAGKVIKYI